MVREGQPHEPGDWVPERGRERAEICVNAGRTEGRREVGLEKAGAWYGGKSSVGKRCAAVVTNEQKEEKVMDVGRKNRRRKVDEKQKSLSTNGVAFFEV